jgi:hypothetical protein
MTADDRDLDENRQLAADIAAAYNRREHLK